MDATFSTGRKICGTPGCTLKDFHPGPCIDMLIPSGSKRKAVQPVRHEPVDFKLHKPSNKFQLGDESLDMLILNNVDVKVRTHTKLLSGHWTNIDGELYEFEATIVGIKPNTEESSSNPRPFARLVVLAVCEEGVQCELNAEVLLNIDTSVAWKPAPSEFLAKHMHEITNDKENVESMKRAGEFAFLYVQACGADPEDIILTLDGNGENRLGMQARFKDMGIDEQQWPRIITIEMDPKTALNQRLIFGNDVFYSGCDSEFTGRRISKGKTLLEDIIWNKNRILTENMKLRVKAVYFDYCGGPPGNNNPHKCRQNFATKIFPSIRNMKVFGLTMSRRQHFKLESTFEQYIAVPANFNEVEEFLDNKHVICKMYVHSNVHPPNELPMIKEAKPRLCSLCKESGHSKRTCQLRSVSTTDIVVSAHTEPEANSTQTNDVPAASEQQPDPAQSVVERSTDHHHHAALAKLKALVTDGLITQAIYDAKVCEVLKNMGL